MLRYPVVLTQEDGKILVGFPDFPNVHTFGDDRQEAMARAVDALETYFMGMIEDHEAIPQPRNRQTKTEQLIELPAVTEAKVALYRQMRNARMSKAELARRLNRPLTHVDRLLDICHPSRLDQLEQAFRVIGKRLVVSFEDAA
ncbi:MAG: type II toxin-antitoxin system HicB family antitoxin [Bryobacteraceae bacterium]